MEDEIITVEMTQEWLRLSEYDFDLEDFRGRTPITRALSRGDIEEVKWFVYKGARTDKVPKYIMDEIKNDEKMISTGVDFFLYLCLFVTVCLACC